MCYYKKAVTFFYLFLFAVVMLGSCGRKTEAEVPKYIFLFIGDGMGYAQIQLASDYLGTIEDVDTIQPKKLSFLDFPVNGTASNYDATSYIPDSASSGSAIASGAKIRTGTINYSPECTYETIAEKLKAQKDYKIGIVSSVNINHTTPADFYAHQECRKMEYEIGKELIDSNFDYFAGGGFRNETGDDSTNTSLYSLSQEAGYEIITSIEELEAFDDYNSKVIAIGEQLDGSKALAYCIDKVEESTTLDQLVSKGTTLLDNEDGFFMMVEGGKIDWACHQNDTATCIQEVIAFQTAVQSAIDFYLEHQDETLIIVTADHETGGLSLGYSETGYNLYLEKLANQTMSYENFYTSYVKKYKEEQTDFSDVMKDVNKVFGLGEDNNTASQSLSYYEMQKLKDAYELSIKFGPRRQSEMTEEEYALYGNCDPFTITILHILANQSGVNWSTYAHTGICVPVFALGKGQELFAGYYDNTDIFMKLKELTGVE